MEFNKSYFVTHPSSVQLLIFGTLITSLWLAEGLILAIPVHEKWRHTFTNMLFIATALPVQLFMTMFVLLEAAWITKNHWGLINRIPHHQSILVKYVVGFVILDFCEYLYHVIMHKINVLWKFHLVHHTDQKLDVSTTVREHPGETFVRMCFLMLWIGITGASFELLLLRQTIQTISNITSHTQFRLSNKVDKWVGLIFVTPNIHHVHHHYQLPYTDCNYGDVLSVWDRLFGTYGKLKPSDTVFGIDTHPDKNVCRSFIKVLQIPFVSKRA
jgi:sterol desaturase/sphingolipid hydroxylase (fatty acid hydroxylase superfamily)